MFHEERERERKKREGITHTRTHPIPAFFLLSRARETEWKKEDGTRARFREHTTPRTHTILGTYRARVTVCERERERTIDTKGEKERWKSDASEWEREKGRYNASEYKGADGRWMDERPRGSINKVTRKIAISRTYYNNPSRTRDNKNNRARAHRWAYRELL